MASVLDYLDWRGDLKFTVDPFGEVDNVICALFSYLDLSKIVSSVPGEETPLFAAVSAYFDRRQGEKLSLGAFIPTEIFDMAKKMASSPRFGGARLTAYRNVISEGENEEDQLQWAAITLLLEDGTLYAAFCGTDDTLVSWKEDAHMTILSEIPSQREAVGYLNEVLAAYPECRARVGGHSKGGNLAVYAAAKCREEQRGQILAVYSNDGPGFRREFLLEEGYLAVKDRIFCIVPEESFVGMLFCHDLPQTVVKSKNKSLLQHDCFSWEVERNRFVRAPGVSESALLSERTVKNWLSKMSPEETREFFNALYRILTYANAKTLTELVGGKRSLLQAYRKLDRPGRQLVADTLRKLFEENNKTVYQTVRASIGSAAGKAGEKPAGAPGPAGAARRTADGTAHDGKRYVERLSGSSLYKIRPRKKQP